MTARGIWRQAGPRVYNDKQKVDQSGVSEYPGVMGDRRHSWMNKGNHTMSGS